LRPYCDEDLDTLIEMIRVHLEEYVVRYIGPWEQSDTMLRGEIPSERAHIKVLEIRGEVVGFLWTQIHDDHFSIEEIHVAASARGQGLGRRMLETAEKMARMRQLTAIQLTVFRDSPAVDFYKASGYSVGSEDADRGQLRMVRTLG
jgi:ribosomal protein S18 acetylase RimI-like enzyme